MKFEVKMDCNNEAFQGGPEVVVRLLREIANRITGWPGTDGATEGGLRDYNGNSVGSYGMKP